MSKVPILDLDALLGKELNDVVCAAYKMGCDQTREVYQKRIEKLETALREIEILEVDPRCSGQMWVETLKEAARKALEGER